MKAQLKKLKIHKDMSEETTCFSAELWLDGKLAAHVQNAGHGGPTDLRFKDEVTEKAFNEYCKSLPNVPSDYFKEGLPMDDELFVDLLISKQETIKLLTRKCKRCTVYVLKTQKEGQYFEAKVAYTPAVAQRLKEKHKDNLAFIVNEDVDAAASAMCGLPV